MGTLEINDIGIGKREFGRGKLGAVLKALGATTRLGGTERPQTEAAPVIGDVSEEDIAASFVRDPRSALVAARTERQVHTPMG